MHHRRTNYEPKDIHCCRTHGMCLDGNGNAVDDG